MSEEISCRGVKDMLEKGHNFHFIDVREEWEHEELNIGAKCYPLGDLPSKLVELSAIKTEEIVIHCKSGARGNLARKYLLSQGFSSVRNMSGGITAYLEL